MKATQRYLDAVKARAGFSSDYALAKRLGMPLSTMSGYRTGARHFDNAMSFKVAELLQIDAREVIAAVELDKAKRESEKDFWRTIAGAAGSILLGGFFGLQPAPANAFSGAASDATGYTLRRKRA